MMADSNFRIYSGNSLRLKDSKAFSIVEGEQRNGVNLVVPLRHLHQVAGAVVAESDRHVLKRGFIELLHADDRTVAQTTHLNNDDGTFVVGFVQDGEYLLQVRAADAATGAPTGNVWTYQDRIMPIEITGNVTDLIISLDAKIECWLSKYSLDYLDRRASLQWCGSMTVCDGPMVTKLVTFRPTTAS